MNQPVGPSDSELPGSWRSTYERYRRFTQAWFDAAWPDIDPHIVKNNRLSQLKHRQCRDGFDATIPPPLAEEIEILHSAIGDLRRQKGDDPEYPLHDVWAAALYLELIEPPAAPRVYRGQARDWPLVPALFRSTDRARDKRQLDAFVRDVQLEHAEIAPDERAAVAIAQHYSEVVGTPTWLLDFTYDRLAALHMSSLGAVDEALGVVLRVSVEEFQRLSDRTDGLIGSLDLVEVSGVARINRQRGVFLNGSHPEVFAQLTPHTLYFRQHAGDVFTDPEREPPITKDSLFPDTDPIKHWAHKWGPGAEPAPQVLPPGPDPTKPLSAMAYRKFASEWTNEGVVDQGLVSLHVAIYLAMIEQPDRDAFDVGLHELGAVLDRLAAGETDDPASKWAVTADCDRDDIVRLLEQLDDSRTAGR